jgi:hypothetical protein
LGGRSAARSKRDFTKGVGWKGVGEFEGVVRPPILVGVSWPAYHEEHTREMRNFREMGFSPGNSEDRRYRLSLRFRP